VPKDGSSSDVSGGNHGQTGSRSEASANDEAKHDIEKGPEGVAAEQIKVQGKKIEAKTEVGASSQ
jgi:hypothetical protein